MTAQATSQATSQVIACTHPGKIGDALYALPAIRALCEASGDRADFYTSEYCRPILDLVAAQPYIRSAYVSDAYRPERMDCGVQPCEVPVPDGYASVHHFGFRTIPDRPLHQFIANQAGVEARPIEYTFTDRETLSGPYIVLSARGESTFRPLFRQFVEQSPVPVVEIGAAGEYVGEGRSLDMTGLTLLDTLPWIAHSAGFVGMSSSMLVLANGFDIPKVVPHDGKSWDTRHWVQSPRSHYMVEPSVDEVLDALGLSGVSSSSASSSSTSPTTSKTYAPSDRFEESNVVRDMHRRLDGVAHRFEHPLRAWEYGIALHALRAAGCRSVLDVGGGGSVFAPSAAVLGMEVTQVDPGDCSAWVGAQSERIGLPLAYHQADLMSYEISPYDAVTCLSVLEHVEDDLSFFRRLQEFVRPGGVLALTVDFWPDGRPQVDGHLRTYNMASLSRLVDAAPGYHLDPPDYRDHGNHVYGYTFASLVLRRAS